jgi:hypothetical protein
MARARIVVGTTAVGGAADGPVQHHGARSYSRSGGYVKTARSSAGVNRSGHAPSKAINLMAIMH